MLSVVKKTGNYRVRSYGPIDDEQGKLYPAFVYFQHAWLKRG
jgi:hypothetical protein